MMMGSLATCSQFSTRRTDNQFSGSCNSSGSCSDVGGTVRCTDGQQKVTMVSESNGKYCLVNLASEIVL